MYRLRHMIAPSIFKNTFRYMHDRKMPEIMYDKYHHPKMIYGIKSEIKEDSITIDKKYPLSQNDDFDWDYDLQANENIIYPKKMDD